MLKGVQYCVAYIDFFIKIIQNFQNHRERESEADTYVVIPAYVGCGKGNGSCVLAVVKVDFLSPLPPLKEPMH
jgi:hypothetical protein